MKNLIVLIATLSLCAGAIAAKAPTTKPVEDPAMARDLARKVPQLKLDAIGLADTIDFLRDMTALNIIVDWKSLKPLGVTAKTPISLDLDEVPVKTALEEVFAKAAEKGKIVAQPVDGVVFILAANDVAALQAEQKAREEKPADAESEKVLRKILPELRIDSVSISDTTQFLRDIAGVKFDVHWTALEAAGVKRKSPLTIRLANAPMRVVLAVLVREAASHSKEPLGYQVREGVIHISTAAELKASAAATPAN